MQITFPQKLYGKTANILFENHRYKVLYGGRGSSKSWCVARALVIRGVQEPTRILCCREFQSSITESVHALLKQQIDLLDLNGFYTVQNATIVGKNGTEFIFAGLRHNVQKIKSTEGIDIAWVEEAQMVSKVSWDTLIPTVRKENSEIWITFNPELETDETYKRFVLDPPDIAVVVKMNWTDNPWFPEVLKLEKDHLYSRDMDAYLNVWEGHCRQTLEGAVYAKEMRAAIEDKRICRVPIIPGKPIDTFWDLGKRDHTSIFFVQFAQHEYRIVDFYQNRGEDLRHYLATLQSKHYVYGTHFLPHDGAHERLGSVSIEDQIEAYYPNKVIVLPRISDIGLGIDATRAIMPLCYFDELRCADGLQALRRYRYDVDPHTGGYSKYPLHDENSDAADAFRQIAMSLDYNEPKKETRQIEVSLNHPFQHGAGWMGR